MFRKPLSRLLYFLVLLTIASIACRATDIYSDMSIDLLESLFPELIYGDNVQQDTDIQEDINIQRDADDQQAADRWDIYQCNAIKEVTFTLHEFEEYQNEDGDTECHYSYEITNIDDVRIIYHTYSYPKDDRGVNEEGWIIKGFGPKLGSYTLRSSIYNCPECIPVRVEFVDHTIAVIYDRPECEWITDGGVHFDVLKITEEKPLISPCTLLYPEHIPDITEGLIRN